MERCPANSIGRVTTFYFQFLTTKSRVKLFEKKEVSRWFRVRFPSRVIDPPLK